MLEQPTIEELQARIGELEAAHELTEWSFRRLAGVENPRDKILLGLQVQLRRVVQIDRFGVYLPASDQLVWHLLAPGQAQPDQAANAWVMANPSPAIRLDIDSAPRRAFLSGKAVAVTDYAVEEMPPGHNEWIEASWGAGLPKLASRLFLPLQIGGESVGLLQLGRIEEVPFTDDEIAVIQPYADQMALAIGNARMAERLAERNAELAASVEREAALARISQRINEHPLDVDGTMQGIADEARLLCRADFARFCLREGDLIVEAQLSTNDSTLAEIYNSFPTRLDEGETLAQVQAILQVRTIINNDVFASLKSRGVAEHIAFRANVQCVMASPILREAEVLGSIVVVRTVLNAFEHGEIATLEAFAAQAAIAIETARAQNALAERNRELAEALELQTATSEVLATIASAATDLDAVLNGLVARAAVLLKADGGGISVLDGAEYGRQFLFNADPGLDTPIGRHARTGANLELRRPLQRAIRERTTVHFAGSFEEYAAEYPDLTPGLAPGPRAMLVVPLLRDDNALGGIWVKRNSDTPFTPADIATLETFTDQAVIAIENARLFSELQERNREVTEALDVQTAMAEVLSVISSSPTDVSPVLQVIADTSRNLLHAESAGIAQSIGGVLTTVTASGSVPLVGRVHSPDGFGTPARAFRDRRTAVLDADLVSPEIEQSTVFRGLRQSMATPLMSDKEAIGVLSVSRSVGPFSDRDQRILETFADQAVIAIENARLFNELQESNREVRDRLQREEATSEILGMISSAPEDLERTLQALTDACTRLTGMGSIVSLPDGDDLVVRGQTLAPGDEMLNAIGHRSSIAESMSVGLAFRTRQSVVLNDPDIARIGAQERTARFGLRAMAAVPILQGETAVGVLAFANSTGTEITGEAVGLLESFAHQAAIAIENARLLRELRSRNREVSEALEREHATAEVMAVVGTSTADALPVFRSIVERVGPLFDATYAAIYILDGDTWTFAAGQYPAGSPSVEGMKIAVSPGNPGYEVVMSRRPERFFGSLEDYESRYPADQEMIAGWRATLPGASGGILHFPLMRLGEVAGLLNLHRLDREFTDEEFATVQTFADQAVIAIENARLFNELEERNREVTEALQRQTATAEVLSIISRSPTAVQPVLDAIVERALTLANAEHASLELLVSPTEAQLAAFASDAEGDPLFEARPLGNVGPIEGRAATEVIGRRATVSFSGRVDELAERFPRSAALAVANQGQLADTVAFASIPLLRADEPIGFLVVNRREAPAFADSVLSLLETFADQAVIAIENARLFNELHESNREVSEALEQQTAIAEVLAIIASTPSDLDAVLPRLADAAARLCEANGSALNYVREGIVRLWTSQTGSSTFPIDGADARHSLMRAVMRTGRPASVAGPIEAWEDQYPMNAARAREAGLSEAAQLAVPLRGIGGPVGVLLVSREAATPFSPRHVALAETFADQAVIAIENARLFNELQAKTEELSASAEILRIVSNFSAQLPDVLDSVIAKAAGLASAERGTIFRVDGSRNVGQAWHNWPAGVANDHKLNAGLPGDRAVLERRIVHIAGTREELAAEFPFLAFDPDPASTRLAVPILLDGEPIGGLVLIRPDRVERFTDAQIALVQSFADQAAIAIQNARLFAEIEEKTRQVEEASRHKSEFLANMSHELRTPLNAIIGYAELLQEECEDLGNEDFLPDLGRIHTAGRHLLTLISGILDLSKVEAGRMTMFLEDFDITTLVRETEDIVRPLVEKNGNAFVVECAPDIGSMYADLVKTRQVLFNLLSNAAKFTEAGTVTLIVRRGSDPDVVTFAVRDSGIGITEEHMSRLFEAFQQADVTTTKKYGGTGLGLTLSRSFCQIMGGDITVETEAGVGSTFSVTLPATVIEVVE